MENVNAKTEEIQVLCAWCKKDLGTKEVTYNEKMAGMPSHGICQECYDKTFKEMGNVTNTRLQ